MRKLSLLLLLATAGQAEIIRYYLHQATIGNDPNHAVNAAVAGFFDVNALLGGTSHAYLSFWDNGYNTKLMYGQFPYPSLFELPDLGTSTPTSVTMYGYELELYWWPKAFIFFTTPLGMNAPSATIDTARSYVTFEDCATRIPGAAPGTTECATTKPVYLYFNSGYISPQQFETSPAPEPATWGLVGVAGVLFARRTKRRFW